VIVSTVRATEVHRGGRLDSSYFLSAGTRAAAALERARTEGLDVIPLGGSDGLAEVWAPNRFKRAYAAPREPQLPYLRPYDIFEYLPQPADWLSKARTERLEIYQVRSGTILQTCSGRNLGPAVVVDAYLERFVLSHDLIRIQLRDTELVPYVATFLNSPIGQSLLRRDKTGSVIDHLSTGHVSAIGVPILAHADRSAISDDMARAIELREHARLTLRAALDAYTEEFELGVDAAVRPLTWTTCSSELSSRLDAAAHSLVVSAARDVVARGGVRCGELARAFLPDWYNRYYVAAEHGRPVLSGKQLLQATPVNLQYLAPRSMEEAENWALRSGWIAFQAAGRAEERLGFPAMIAPDRDGWLGSDHVMRVAPREARHSGWLYLAFGSPAVQAQLKAVACGSVVDKLYPRDVLDVVLPPPPKGAQSAAEGWAAFAEAAHFERRAVEHFEDSLRRVAGAT
jgi:hypothetical protein